MVLIYLIKDHNCFINKSKYENELMIVNKLKIISNQPPCNMEIKLTLSFSFKSGSSL